MENQNIAVDPKTEEFDFKKHFVKALLAGLYYLILYYLFKGLIHKWDKTESKEHQQVATKMRSDEK